MSDREPTNRELLLDIRDTQEQQAARMRRIERRLGLVDAVQAESERNKSARTAGRRYAKRVVGGAGPRKQPPG